MSGSARPATMFIAVLVLMSIVIPATAAHASHVQCGDVITHDTRLDSDLVNCPGNGVVIGADSITLDLNGHTIDGSGAPPGPSNGVDAVRHDGLTVESGTIQDFRAGVAFDHAGGNTLRRVDLHDLLVAGVQLFYSQDNRIERNTIARTGNGLLMGDEADRNIVTQNSISDSGDAFYLQPFDAIQLHAPSFNGITRNVLSNNQYGIFGVGRLNQIARNRITANRESAIELRLGLSAGNLIDHNYVKDNGDGVLILRGAGDTTVVQNRVLDNSADGIQIGPGTEGTTTVERNVSSGNGDDGIDVDTMRAVITRNGANANGDLGIEAVPGVTDGGGNKARGNGNLAQCLNVTCR